MLSTLLQQPAFAALEAGPALVAFAAVLTATLVVALLDARTVAVRVVLITSPAPGRAVSLRVRSRDARFLRLRDPDAPGRTRPRAPGLRCSAA
jgi:uncharacterized protein DUF6412